MTQRLLTLPEAAAYLRMAVPTFREHRQNIGGVKLSKRWLFTETELLKYLESKRSKPLHELQTA